MKKDALIVWLFALACSMAWTASEGRAGAYMLVEALPASLLFAATGWATLWGIKDRERRLATALALTAFLPIAFAIT